MIDRRNVLVSVVAAGLVALPAAAAAPASAKTWKASVIDPTGDGPVPGRDLTEVKFRYKSNGSVLFAVTVAGPIDPAAADAAVGVSVGSSCKRLLGLGGGLFSEPDPVVFSKVKGRKHDKLGPDRKGEGEVTGNVYTLSFKHRSFKHWRPKCFAVALVDPSTPKGEVQVPFDQTGEIKIK